MRQVLPNRLLLGVVYGGLIGVILVLLWAGGVFRTIQLRLSDIYFIPRPVNGNIVLVALDDMSLQRYGRSPAEWSRTVYADLVDSLVAAQARVIAFDLLFTERGDGDDTFIRAIEAARQSDSRTRIVVAAAGVLSPTFADSTAAFPQALQYRQVLLPQEPILDVVDNVGYVNAISDVDSSLRRLPGIIYDNTEAHLSFSLATYLAYLRIPAGAMSQVLHSEANRLLVTNDRSVPVDGSGQWLINFYGEPSTAAHSTFTRVSLVDVLAGQVDPDIFHDKVVLVGLMTISGEHDRFPVPVTQRGGLMSGVEIQANAIETLMQGDFVYRPPAYGQGSIILCLAIIMSLIFAYPRWYYKFGLMLIFVVVGLIVALLIFNATGLQLPLLYIVFATVIPGLLAIGVDTSREVMLRRRSDFLLQSLVAVSEKPLEIQQIVKTIADDICNILPGSEGVIYVREEPESALHAVYSWPVNHGNKRYQPLVEAAEKTGQMTLHSQLIVVPIWWQGKTLAVIAVTHPQVRGRSALLEDFAMRLAPTFENAYLYQRTLRQQSTLKSVLGSTPAAVLVLDDEYRIRQYNERAARLFDVERLPGQLLIETLESTGVEHHTLTDILIYLETSVTFHHELTIGQKTYSVEGALIPSLNQWVLALSDITELIELNKLKTQMLRMASHDLKNPLGRISGYAQLLATRPNLDEKTVRYVDSITKSADEMLRLINDILDLERSRSGKFNVQTVSLRDVVTQVASKHEPDAILRHQRFVADIPDDPVIVRGDLRQLSQTVDNLIGNAIKYTPEAGTIDVRLKTINEQVRLEVSDTGYGIPEDKQADLFKEFYRVRTDETAQIAGTGLGLSLVKAVVEAHGGQVGVESQAGVGSTFYLTLPIAKGVIGA